MPTAGNRFLLHNRFVLCLGYICRVYFLLGKLQRMEMEEGWLFCWIYSQSIINRSQCPIFDKTLIKYKLINKQQTCFGDFLKCCLKKQPFTSRVGCMWDECKNNLINFGSVEVQFRMCAQDAIEVLDWL